MSTGFVTNAEKATTDAQEWAQVALEHLDGGHVESAAIEAQVAQALALVSIADSLLALKATLGDIIAVDTICHPSDRYPIDRVHSVRNSQ